MTYETKDMTGSLFRNGRKTEESHADYNGSIRIGGRDYWLNCWLNTDKNGGKYMKISAKAKDGTADRPAAPTAYAAQAPLRGSMKDALDDEVPF